MNNKKHSATTRVGGVVFDAKGIMNNTNSLTNLFNVYNVTKELNINEIPVNDHLFIFLTFDFEGYLGTCHKRGDNSGYEILMHQGIRNVAEVLHVVVHELIHTTRANRLLSLKHTIEWKRRPGEIDAVYKTYAALIDDDIFNRLLPRLSWLVYDCYLTLEMRWEQRQCDRTEWGEFKSDGIGEDIWYNYTCMKDQLEDELRDARDEAIREAWDDIVELNHVPMLPCKIEDNNLKEV